MKRIVKVVNPNGIVIEASLQPQRGRSLTRDEMSMATHSLASALMRAATDIDYFGAYASELKVRVGGVKVRLPRRVRR